MKYSTTFDKTQADALRSIGNQLDGFEKRLSSVARQMDTRDSTMSRLATAVRADTKAVPEFAARARAAGSALIYAADEYRRAENAAEGAVQGPTLPSERGANQSIWDLISGPLGTIGDGVGVLSDVLEILGKDFDFVGGIGAALSIIGNLIDGEYIPAGVDAAEFLAKLIAKKVGEGATSLAGKASQAGPIISAVANSINHIYKNFYKDDISKGEAFLKTGIEIGLEAGIAWGTYALAGTAVVGAIAGTVCAPLVVAAAIVGVGKFALDGVVKHFTDKSGIVEWVADGIIDTGKTIVEEVGKFGKKVKSLWGSVWSFVT